LRDNHLRCLLRSGGGPNVEAGFNLRAVHGQRQTGDMQHGPCWGPTNIRHHCTWGPRSVYPCCRPYGICGW